MLADYSLLDVFWSMLLFFLLVIWIWLLISVVVDLFRDHELSGWAKAAWILFLVVLPMLGVLVYLIARGGQMAERNVQRMADQQAQFDQYIQTTASGATGSSSADELAKLHDLHAKGVLSDEEWAAAKAKALA